MTQSPLSSGDIPKIGAPANRALELSGFTHLEHLTQVTEKELLALHGVGSKAIRILKAALAEKGWSFKTAVDHDHLG